MRRVAVREDPLNGVVSVAGVELRPGRLLRPDLAKLDEITSALRKIDDS